MVPKNGAVFGRHFWASFLDLFFKSLRLDEPQGHAGIIWFASASCPKNVVVSSSLIWRSPQFVMTGAVVAVVCFPWGHDLFSRVALFTFRHVARFVLLGDSACAVTS
jgi:hypothetical protein